MGLIYKSYLLTLNQRVQGSSPCAPTNILNNLGASNLRTGWTIWEVIWESLFSFRAS